MPSLSGLTRLKHSLGCPWSPHSRCVFSLMPVELIYRRQDSPHTLEPLRNDFYWLHEMPQCSSTLGWILHYVWGCVEVVSVQLTLTCKVQELRTLPRIHDTVSGDAVDDNVESKKKSTPVGAIVGGTLAAIVALVGAAAAVSLYKRHRRKKAAAETSVKSQPKDMKFQVQLCCFAASLCRYTVLATHTNVCAHLLFRCT